jgi:predicted nucleic acid-binding protein
MPDVVVDTSCLIVLDKIEGLFVLEQMYGNLLVTPTVKSEYGKELPAFVEVRAVRNPNYGTLLRGILDPGEASILALALEVEDPLVILDDRKARGVAKEAGIPLTGTLGVILAAKNKGIVSEVASILDRLTREGFWISDDLRSHLLKLAGEA